MHKQSDENRDNDLIFVLLLKKIKEEQM